MPKYNPLETTLSGETTLPPERALLPEADPSKTDYQFLEDLSTAYWHSEVLFSALELRLFDHIEGGENTLASLAGAALCREDALIRLLTVMSRMELVGEAKGIWYNSQAARNFLVEESPEYMGDFFLYRRYMQENWLKLTDRVAGAGAEKRTLPSGTDDYEVRNFNYVRALDALARQKAREIKAFLAHETLPLPILDIGGGAGTLCRTLLEKGTDLFNEKFPGTNPARQAVRGVLFDLPEVIEAARKIYPEEEGWEGIRTIGGDFRSHEFPPGTEFGLIVISNFLHAYGKEDAKKLLEKAVGLLSPGGRILIHDYFPDRVGRSPFKGPVYDLAMMLNTYDGACHNAASVVSWLDASGLKDAVVKDLETDSSVILAGNDLSHHHLLSVPERWAALALSEGFRRTAVLPAEKIVTAPWVRKKCRYGCDGYGKNLMCPPFGMDDRETKRMVDAFSVAIVLEGSPPGRDFHFKLLELEKKAFLAGFHKAFVFGAGPCTVCKKCPGEGNCLHTDLARPSMESSGIDVYETAANAGLDLVPVKERGEYIKYIGLLLLE